MQGLRGAGQGHRGGHLERRLPLVPPLCEAVVLVTSEGRTLSPRRDDLRDIVIREMQKAAARDERFRAVVEPLGFFTVMDLMDGIVDAVLAGLEVPDA